MRQRSGEAAGATPRERLLGAALEHFGSREGLLAEVTREVEARQRALMSAAYDADLPPLEAGARYWEETVEATLRYGPLFFELAAHAMQGKEHAATLRAELIGPGCRR